VSPPENLLEIFDPKSRIWGQFGPENKLMEGQPNEYDVICRNASVLAFHLWPAIFAGVPFRLQNICRNGVQPRSRTTTHRAHISKLASAARGGRTMGHTNTQTYRRTDAGPLGYIDSAPHTTRAVPVIRFAFLQIAAFID